MVVKGELLFVGLAELDERPDLAQPQADARRRHFYVHKLEHLLTKSQYMF